MKITSVFKSIAKFFNINKIFFSSLLIVIFMYAFLYISINKNPFIRHDPFDQYTRQAKAWTEGKANVPEDVSYLEIAEYQGKYYISFPPVPSIVMLPMYLLFGDNTPNTMVTFLEIFFTFIIAYKIFSRKIKPAAAAFTAGFFVFASSALVISFSGDVWFHAQVLSFLLLTLAVCALTSSNKAYWNVSLVFVALSVGCRPLNIVYFVPFYYMLYTKLRDSGMLKTEDKKTFKAKQYLLMILKYIWMPVVVGVALMVYNYIRFDNPFVFGHKYLPNFAENSQFGFEYLLNNLKCTFRLPTIEGGKIVFPAFDGFAFWMCCPFFLYAFIEFILRDKKTLDWVVLGTFLVHFFLMHLHMGMGGPQFGTRYMVDLLPYMLILVYNGEIKERVYAYVLAAFGIIINVYGVGFHYMK